MIIETLDCVSLGASLTQANEDACGRAGARAWVIDGATDLGPPDLFDGLTGSAWIAHFANARFSAHVGAAPVAQIGAVFADIGEAFAREARRRPVDRWEEPTASFLMCDVAAERICAFWLGDCVGLVLSVSGAFTRFGGTQAGVGREDARAREVRAALASPRGPLYKAALDDRRAARNRVNGAGGSWLLGLHPGACDHVKTQEIALDGPAIVLLMTDGFAALADRYARVDDRGLIEAAGTLGLAPLAAELRRLETVEDPECERWPRFKPSDDATALLLRVS